VHRLAYLHMSHQDICVRNQHILAARASRSLLPAWRPETRSESSRTKHGRAISDHSQPRSRILAPVPVDDVLPTSPLCTPLRRVGAGGASTLEGRPLHQLDRDGQRTDERERPGDRAEQWCRCKLERRCVGFGSGPTGHCGLPPHGPERHGCAGEGVFPRAADVYQG
jgi:hypothetical protein